MSRIIQSKIIQWHRKYGRHDLPWQKNQTPYRVWLSEIMLQQTQVKTATPYYLRFTKVFPNLKQLANANIDEVLALWTGLGYYARARNLHKTAQIIQRDYNGRFPSTVEEVALLPGIGKSTAGAILSFSKNIPATILDGNVKRILCRMYLVDTPYNQAKTIKSLWTLAEKLTPSDHIKEYNQAVMDIGATICTRTKPRCKECPVQTHCKAYALSTQEQYPVKSSKKSKRTHRSHYMLMIQTPCQSILVEKRPASGIWGGLWCPPEDESKERLLSTWEKRLSTTFNDVIEMDHLLHKFSHFDLTIRPLIIKTNTDVPDKPSSSYKAHRILTDSPIGLPAPVKHLLQQIAENC